MIKIILGKDVKGGPSGIDCRDEFGYEQRIFKAIRERNTPEMRITGNFNFSVIETENH